MPHAIGAAGQDGKGDAGTQIASNMGAAAWGIATQKVNTKSPASERAKEGMMADWLRRQIENAVAALAKRHPSRRGPLVWHDMEDDKPRQ